jgi:CubicO group peptidase (beta-lactamase class C family)
MHDRADLRDTALAAAAAARRQTAVEDVPHVAGQVPTRHQASGAMPAVAGPRIAGATSLRRDIPGVSPVPLPSAGIGDAAELEGFVDREMTALLARANIAGAALSIVSRDRVLLSKGYGHGDIARGVRVDAGATLFRAGSVSKPLTWTAFMQLLERGLLSEDEDLTRHLDFRLPGPCGGPILAQHLLTHSAGFEANSFGYMAARSAATTRSLATTVSRHAPARVRAAGVMASYVNWGAALAGRIIELRSGLPFDTYMESEVFAPLRMAHSTFREPVPARLGAEPVGYTCEGGRFQAQPFEYYHGVAPAGGMTTTATDMAQFMIAHLREGANTHGRVLDPSTARRMLTRAPNSHPCLNGPLHGFCETYVNGRRMVGHSGRTVYFGSKLALLPAEQIGIFVVVNTQTWMGFLDNFVQAFMDRFFPAELPRLDPSAGPECEVRKYEGAYAYTARSYMTSEKIFGLRQGIAVSCRGRNKLTTRGLLAAGPVDWIHVQGHTGLFRRIDGEEMIAFIACGADRGMRLVGPDPLNPAERVGPLDAPLLDEKLQASSRAALCFAAITCLVAAHYSWRAALLGATLALTDALILRGIARTFSCDSYSMLVRLPWPFVAAMALAVISTLMTAATTAVAATTWVLGDWSPFARVAYTMVALLALGFTEWLRRRNLIGPRFA